MKGLLVKDFYVLIKQMKIFLLFVLVFSIMPGNSMVTFAVVYSAMLPITALAYDERSKWDELADMLPYSKLSIVGGKYMLGLIAVTAATLLSLAEQFVVGMFKHIPIEADALISLGLIWCVALIALSVMLPLMYRFGVEKGRVALFIIFGVIVAGSVILGQSSEIWNAISWNPAVILAILAPASIAVGAASVFISVGVYRKHAN